MCATNRTVSPGRTRYARNSPEPEAGAAPAAGEVLLSAPADEVAAPAEVVPPATAGEVPGPDEGAPPTAAEDSPTPVDEVATAGEVEVLPAAAGEVTPSNGATA
jgi:hypothetical protein